METALARELGSNAMDWNGVPVLKSVGLFAPNASGKSNILKAIDFCCRMILDLFTKVSALLSALLQRVDTQ